MKRPPIVGAPATRPVCPTCKTPLKPAVQSVMKRDDAGRLVIPITLIERRWYRWRGYPTHAEQFCSLQCALEFAVAALRAGYRLK